MISPDPQQLGEFEILERLGRGGMGTVYKARQSSLGRIVALKVLPGNLSADDEFIVRFKAEARAAASLNHPGIVQVYAAGADDGVHYFAMEYVDGESLQARLQRKGRLSPLEALAICTHVATALNHGWQRARIIHRDIKPDNIFLSSEGAVKLGDLGLAKSLGSEGAQLTQTGTSMGTPYYISPEQAHGEKTVDFRSDIYSLGCTLYHLVTGRTPYMASTPMAVMIKHITEPPPDIFKIWPECPPPLAALLAAMLAKDAADRPQSYDEVIAAMLAAHEQIQNPAATPAASVAKIPPQAAAKTTAPVPDHSARNGEAGRFGYVAGGAVIVALLAGLLAWAPGKTPRLPALNVANPNIASPAPGATAPRPAPPPPAANQKIMLFDGSNTIEWKTRDGAPAHWPVINGTLEVGSGDLKTKRPFQDFQLHAEFWIPLFPPNITGQNRGNSGIFLQDRYEIQILDSFGLPASAVGCGAMYNLRAPDRNACAKPETWQTYDITFRAARFDAAGRKIANARITAVQNGVTIHNNAEIKGNGDSGVPESPSPGSLRLQDRGNKVRFRNLWIIPQ